jgi:predicted transcriptional regulator
MIKKPTDSELAVLTQLWDNGPQTVRQIHDKIAESKPIGYTTTLKIMQIMFEKGLLTRKKTGKSHLYSPAVTRESTQASMIDKMLTTVFKGSASQLVMQALGNNKASKKELAEIRAYLDKLEDKA